MNDWSKHIVISAFSAQTAVTEFYYYILPWLNYISKRQKNVMDREEIVNDIFLKLLLKLRTEYTPSKGKLHSFVFIVAINELSRLCREKKKKIDLLYVLDADKGFYGRQIKQALIEIIPDIDYDRAYDVVVSSLNEDEQLFIFDYLNDEKTKSDKDKSRFYYLKNKLKTIAKINT